MRVFLDQIISTKYQELKEKKRNTSLSVLKNKLERHKSNGNFFARAILNPKIDGIALIAEIKLASPAAGVLGKASQVIKRARQYEEVSTDAISVVVDKTYFQGDLALIRQIKGHVSIPVLAKEFILDPYQIYQAALVGADAILLISKIVSRKRLTQFVRLAIDLGMEPVVEVTTHQELDSALATNTSCIAVNARNLSDFSVDVGRACRLLRMVPKEKIALGFSGIRGKEEVEQYRRAGAKAVLVGTSLMRTREIKSFIKELR